MGGKGGGGGNPAAEAAAREAARRARISGNIRAVKERFYAVEAEKDVPEALYGSRMKNTYFPGEDQYRNVPEQYVTNQGAIDEATAWNKNKPFTESPTAERLAAMSDIEDRVRNRFMPEFADQTTDARRELKFALARRGIFGGSAQVDAEGRFRDRVAEGEREIGQRSVSARNEKMRLDTNLMNNLIAQAQADTERSALLSGIGASQLSNASRAQALATDRSLATGFGDVGTLFKKINDQRALQSGIGSTSNLARLLGGNQNQSTADLFASGAKTYGGSVTTA
jgi:hypothetical protein